MRKVRLEIEALAVESFETDAPAKERGTVRAHVATEWNTCQGPTCDPGNTCWDSCDGVCGTYFCITDGSCWNASCVYTCRVGC